MISQHLQCRILSATVGARGQTPAPPPVAACARAGHSYLGPVPATWRHRGPGDRVWGGQDYTIHVECLGQGAARTRAPRQRHPCSQNLMAGLLIRNGAGERRRPRDPGSREDTYLEARASTQQHSGRGRHSSPAAGGDRSVTPLRKGSDRTKQLRRSEIVFRVKTFGFLNVLKQMYRSIVWQRYNYVDIINLCCFCG